MLFIFFYYSRLHLKSYVCLQAWFSYGYGFVICWSNYSNCFFQQFAKLFSCEFRKVVFSDRFSTFHSIWAFKSLMVRRDFFLTKASMLWIYCIDMVWRTVSLYVLLFSPVIILVKALVLYIQILLHTLISLEHCNMLPWHAVRFPLLSIKLADIHINLITAIFSCKMYIALYRGSSLLWSSTLL